MAVITPKTLVLRGVGVLTGVVTSKALGLGYQAEAPAPFSMRHPSPSNPEANPGLRLIDEREPVVAADRAGRSGCQAGVLERRSLAVSASGAQRPCWRPQEGRSSLSAIAGVGSKSRIPPMSADASDPQRLTTISLQVLPKKQQVRQRREVVPARFTPAGSASTASTRGTGL
jgi:hypothetical protein